MASPAQLVETISAATGLSLPTVVDIDRKLVKARLRTKTGRGFYAAQMSPFDAARLLTAILASPQANLAAEAVARYAGTRIDKARSSDRLLAAAQISDLASLGNRHSFVDALAAVIASASTGALAKLATDGTAGDVPRIEVYAFTQATRGRIRLSGLSNSLTASVEYALTGKRLAATAAGDLEQSRRITERTILPVAQLLAKEGQHDQP